MLVGAKSNDLPNPLENDHDEVNPPDYGALRNKTTETAVTIANTLPCLGVNEEAAAAAYTQSQTQENLPTQYVEEGNSGIEGNN